ncbi:MAG: aldose epimerase family protein [Bacteroidota bacterium]
MKITKSKFGDLNDSQEVKLFSLENDNGILVKISDYGGIITHLFTPDKNGKNTDIVLGFDEFQKYTGEHPYFGALVGRFANRIAGGKFKLNGKEYQLAVNNGPNHLHGGNEGFDKKLWTAWTEKKEGELILKLAYESEHMEEGFPGNLMVEVSYTLNNKNELIIDYKAETDQDTIINLTNHSYFNLNIENGNILDHYLQLKCSRYTPVDEVSIPTGELKEVKGTEFDFTTMKKIGQDFNKLENGYDHNFIIDKEEEEFKWFAKVLEKKSGRTMEVGTTEPGVQFYTSNYLNQIEGKGGINYQPQHALCLETQHFPDSPNKPDFPSVVLKKSEQYRQKTVYKFSVEE